MSHVDEGALHAYLDGALDEYPPEEAARIREHLEACEECAARLADEARVRDAAAGILAGASPAVDAPPLEELRARARARATARRTTGRLERLSWAASVVVALGAGWMLRGMVPPLGSPAGVRAPVVGAEPAADAAPEDAAAPAAPSISLPRPSPGEASSTDAPARAVEGARTVLPDAAPATTGGGVEAGAGAGAPAVQPPADVVATTEPAAAGGVAADTARIRAQDSVERTAVAEPPRTAQTAPPAERLAAERARAEVAARLREVSEPPSRAAAPTAAAAADRPDAGRGVVLEDAARDERSLHVPGLEVVSITRLDGGAPAGSVRVLQLLESGDTLEVLHLPPGSDPSQLGPRGPDGRTELVEQRDGGWLILRAAVEGEVLAALLERMEG